MLSGMMNLVERKKKVPTGNSLVQQAQKAAAKSTVEGLGLSPKKGSGKSLTDTLAKMGVQPGMGGLPVVTAAKPAAGVGRSLMTGPARPKGRSLAGVMKDLDKQGTLDPDTRKLVRDSLMVRSGNNLGLEKWPYQGSRSAENLKVDNATLLETLEAAKSPEGKARLVADLQRAREERQAASAGMALYNQAEGQRRLDVLSRPGRDASGGKWGPTDKVYREQEKQRAIREEKETRDWKKKGGFAQTIYGGADKLEKKAGDIAKSLPVELNPPALLMKMLGQEKLAKEGMGFLGSMGAGLLTQIPRVAADAAVQFDGSAPAKVDRDATMGLTLAVPDLVDEIFGTGLITTGAKALIRGGKGLGKKFTKEALAEGLEKAAARKAAKAEVPASPGVPLRAEDGSSATSTLKVGDQPAAGVRRSTVIEFAPGSAEPIIRRESAKIGDVEDGSSGLRPEGLASPEVGRSASLEIEDPAAREKLKREIFGDSWPEFTERLEDPALPGRSALRAEDGRSAPSSLKMEDSASPEGLIGAGRPKAEVSVMAPEDLKVNPEIQYKTDLSDQANKVTSKFKDVTAYNVDQGGLLTVWQRLDGTREVAHGHHRAELAKRAKRFVRDVPGGGLEEVDRAVPVRVLKEEDGWTLPDVRRVAAVENLRNGDGSALDAVMVLKELGVGRDKLADYGVQIKGALGRNVDGLLRAGEDVLSMVRKGEAPEEAAAGVAASGLPVEHQGRALARAVASGRIGYREAESFANDFRHFVVEDSTASLFGDELAVLDDAVEEGFRLKEAVRGEIIGRWDQLKKGLNLEPLDREVIDKAARSEELNRMGKKGEVAYKIDAVMDKFEDIVQLRGRLARQVKAGELTEADARKTLRDAVLPELQLKQKAYIEGRRGNQSGSVSRDDGGVRPAGRAGEAGNEVRSVGRGSGETGSEAGKLKAEDPPKKKEDIEQGSAEAGPSSFKGGEEKEVPASPEGGRSGLRSEDPAVAAKVPEKAGGGSPKGARTDLEDRFLRTESSYGYSPMDELGVAGPVYHETSLDGAKQVGMRVMAGPRNHPAGIYAAENLDLAKGQGGKGVVMEFDPVHSAGLKPESLQNKTMESVAGQAAEWKVGLTTQKALVGFRVSSKKQLDSLAKVPSFAKRFDFENPEVIEGGFRVRRKGAAKAEVPAVPEDGRSALRAEDPPSAGGRRANEGGGKPEARVPVLEPGKTYSLNDLQQAAKESGRGEAFTNSYAGNVNQARKKLDQAIKAKESFMADYKPLRGDAVKKLNLTGAVADARRDLTAAVGQYNGRLAEMGFEPIVVPGPGKTVPDRVKAAGTKDQGPVAPKVSEVEPDRVAAVEAEFGPDVAKQLLEEVKDRRGVLGNKAAFEDVLEDVVYDARRKPLSEVLTHKKSAPKAEEKEMSFADMLEPEFELQAQKGGVKRKADGGSQKAEEGPTWNMRQEGLPGFGDKEGQFKLGEEPLFQGQKGNSWRPVEVWGDSFGNEYRGRYAVASDDGKIIGILDYSTVRGEKDAIVRHVEVAPEFKRKGVASALYDKLAADFDGGQIKTFGNFQTEEGAAFRKAWDSRRSEPLFQGRKRGPKPGGKAKLAGEGDSTLVVDRASFKEGLAKQFGYGVLDDGTDVAETVTRIADARAKVQLRLMGKEATPEALDEWYKENFFAITQKGAYMEDLVTPQQMQKGKGAFVEVADGRALITAFEAADRTTAIHELGHAFRRKLEPNLQVRATRHYVKEGTDWTREAEERFAQDLERYFRDGEAPTRGLVPVFEKIKDWFREVYKKLTGTGLERALTPRVRALFDEMFGGEFPLSRPFDPGEGWTKPSKGGPTYVKELQRTLQLTDEEAGRLKEIRKRFEVAEDVLYGKKQGAADHEAYRVGDEEYRNLPGRLKWELSVFAGDTLEGRRLADEESLRKLEMGEDPADVVDWDAGDGAPMVGAPGPLKDPLPAELAKRPEVKIVRDSHPSAPALKEMKKAVRRRNVEENNWRGMFAVAVGSAGDILRYADSQGSKGREAGERIFRDLERILNVASGRTVQALDVVLDPVKEAYGKYWWDWNPKAKAELEDMAYKIHKASVQGKSMPEGLNEAQTKIHAAWTKVNSYLAQSGVETGAMVDRMVKGDIGKVLMGERVHFYGKHPVDGTLGELVGEVVGWAEDGLEVLVKGEKMWLTKYKPFSTKSLVKPEVFWPRRVKPEIMDAIRRGQGEDYDDLIRDVALAMDGKIPMTPDIKAQEEALDLLRGKVDQEQIREAEMAVDAVFRGKESAGQAVGYGARLEKQRLPFALPDKFYDYSFGTAQSHIQEAVMRVTKAEIWGADGANLVAQMKDMGAPAYYMDVIENVFGTGIAQTSGERTLKKTVSGIGDFMNLTLMTGLGTAVKQLPQYAAAVGVMGVKPAAFAAGQTLIDLGRKILKKENGLDAIRKSGAVESDLLEMISVDQANGWSRKAVNVALTWSGVKPVDKSLRYLAATAGKIALYDNIGTNALGKARLVQMADGTFKDNRHYRFLKEWVRLDDEAIERLAKTGKPTPQDELMAYHAGARTQGRTRSGDMPTILTSQPVFRLLAQFQSFNVAQSKLLRYLWDEAVVHKNPVPLVRTVAAYAAAGYVSVELLRELMSKVENKEKRPVPEDFIQRIAYYVSQSGMLGMLGRTSEAFVDPMKLVKAQDDEDKNYVADVAKKELASLGAIQPPILGLAVDVVGAIDHVAKGTDLSGMTEKFGDAWNKATQKGPDLKGAGEDLKAGIQDAGGEFFDRDLGVAAMQLARDRVVLLNRFMKRSEPDRNFVLYERERERQRLKKEGKASEEDIRLSLDSMYPIPTEPYAPPERIQWDLVYYGLLSNGDLEMTRAEAREATIEMLGKKPPMVGKLKDPKKKPLLSTGDFSPQQMESEMPASNRERMKRAQSVFESWKKKMRPKAGVK